MGGKGNEVTIGGPTTIGDEGSQKEGARMHQTRATSDGRKGKDQVYAPQDRSLGLA